MIKRKKKLLSSRDTDKLKRWLEKEFGAKELPYKKNEYQFHCPWCDKEKSHNDYTFNLEKQEGHCWRGFSELCESGHSLLVFVSFYYGISFQKAKSVIRSKFESEDSLQRVKKKLKDIDLEKDLSFNTERIVWSLPRGLEEVINPNSKGARRALAWLRSVRKFPKEAIDFIRPLYAGEKYRPPPRPQRNHNDRVFFPVKTMDNRAWISYSMLKKSTRANPKTLNPPGNILSSMLYLYDFCEGTEPVILCEGIFDALRLFVFGFNSVALFGTNVSEAQIDLLNMLSSEEVVVCLDADATRPKFNEKTNKWSSKAYKVSRILRDYYFGDVSIMKIHSLDKNPDSKLDPDLLTFDQAHQLFSQRESFNTLAASLRRLKAKYA